MRLAAWKRYNDLLEPLESGGYLRRPIVPVECQHNAHMYYVLLAPAIDRKEVIQELQGKGITAVFHYIPLHSSPAGLRYGRTVGEMRVTDSSSARLIRLPLWMGISDEQQVRVFEALSDAINRNVNGSCKGK